MKFVNVNKIEAFDWKKYEGHVCRMYDRISTSVAHYGLLHTDDRDNTYFLSVNKRGNQSDDNWRTRYGMPVSFQLSSNTKETLDHARRSYGWSELEIGITEETMENENENN